VGSKKSRKKKRKKPPVLTSPWKIGMFVALMLLVTGSGVGYYFVRTYAIGLTWLGPDKSRWIVDSYAFFKETYPLAAGMVLMSLIAYFIIASAVRRYRYYLDSGQDYRRMVSLAESIDDLTNPAQIARLSDYPELQDVLRNYGDQIREISAEINERQDESKSVDLEMEIDSILKGNPVTESLVEGKWWASVARKVETALKERSGQPVTDDHRQADQMRRAVSRAALACGRIMESAAGASEEIARIADDAGHLVSASRVEERSASRAPVSTQGIIEQVAQLEQVRQTLGGFSEQNNGLALNIALMAARGNVDEHQLAQYAENVRMTAERFGALGRDLDGIARGISEACRDLASATPAAAPAAVDPALASMAEGVERGSRTLMERIASLVEDAEEIGSAIRSAGGEPAPQTPPAPAAAPAAQARPEDESLRLESTDGRVEEKMIVNFGSGSPSDAQPKPADDLVIDHGGSWSGTSGAPAPKQAEPRQAQPAPPPGDEGSLKISGLTESLAAEHAAAMGGDVSSAPHEEAAPAAAPDGTGDWMEMPGHRWVKVDAEHEQPGPVEQPQVQDVEQQPPLREAEPPLSAAPEPVQHAEDVVETAGAAMPAGPDSEDTDEDPIYDLSELGAVECLDEAEATL